MSRLSYVCKAGCSISRSIMGLAPRLSLFLVERIFHITRGVDICHLNMMNERINDRQEGKKSISIE